jgi:hypothetical protein
LNRRDKLSLWFVDSFVALGPGSNRALEFGLVINQRLLPILAFNVDANVEALAGGGGGSEPALSHNDVIVRV